MSDDQIPGDLKKEVVVSEEMIAGNLAEKSLDYFHDSMNNEISRLWQRSIFLVALLGLIFAGYGNTLLKFFDSVCLHEKGLFVDSALNFVCVGISFFGVLFSALWIMMMKGSKAWQEKYEHTLFSFIGGNVRSAKLATFAKYGFAHGYLKALEKGKFSNSLLKTKSGAYSVSKINIILGIISLLFWMIAGVVHSLFVPCEFGLKIGGLMGVFIRSQLWMPAVFVVATCFCVWILSKRCKSSVIQEKQDNPEE